MQGLCYAYYWQQSILGNYLIASLVLFLLPEQALLHIICDLAVHFTVVYNKHVVDLCEVSDLFIFKAELKGSGLACCTKQLRLFLVLYGPAQCAGREQPRHLWAVNFDGDPGHSVKIPTILLAEMVIIQQSDKLPPDRIRSFVFKAVLCPL